jgi:hypothetical protein
VTRTTRVQQMHFLYLFEVISQVVNFSFAREWHEEGSNPRRSINKCTDMYVRRQKKREKYIDATEYK